MRAKRIILSGLASAAPLLILIDSTRADPGLSASLTLGERLRHVEKDGFSRPQDEGTSAVTTFDFSLDSETAGETFSLDLGADIPLFFDDNDNSSSTLEDPFARLDYTRENRSTLLSFSTSYRESDVGESNFLDETVDDNVVTGGGTRELLSGRVALTLGRESPVRTDLSYSYLRSTFEDADPDQSDSTTNTVAARVTFRLNPVASAFVFADWRDEDRDLASQSDRTTSALGIGTTYDISARSRVTAQLSYDRDEDDTDSNEGLGFQFGATRAVSTGTYSVDLSGTETIDGFRQQVSGGRSYNLARGSFSFSLGAVKDEGTSVEPLANLQLALQLTEISRFNLGLSQSPDFDDNDDSVIRTRLNVGYNLDINAVSSLSADFQVAEDDRFGTNAGDSRSILASLSYNRALTRDWDLVGGISYESDQNENRADTNTSTVFLGVERTFDFRR